VQNQHLTKHNIDKGITSQLVMSYLFIFLLALGCVSEKKPGTRADCGEGNRFDEVTRKCIITRSTPSATLQNLTINENSGRNNINLEYSDNLGTPANRCQVTLPSTSRIEVNSPLLYEMSDSAEELRAFVEGVVNDISSITFPSQSAEAQAVYNNHTLPAYLDLRTSTSLEVSIDSRNRLIQSAQSVLFWAREAGSSFLLARADNLQTRIDNFNKRYDHIERRCHCLAGACRSTVVPRPDFSGDETFTYEVFNALEGASPPRTVRTRVVPVRRRPAPVYGATSILESATSSAVPVSGINLPHAIDLKDPLNVFSTLFTYTLVDAPTNGVLSNCLGINGAAGRNCTYLPNDGNFSDATFDAGFNLVSSQLGLPAERLYQGIILRAQNIGANGNSIRVRLLPYQGLGFPEIGSIRLDGTSRGPVINVIVLEGLTTAQDVIDFINDSGVATRFIEADLQPLADGNLLIQLGEAQLIGGQNAQDTFSYQVKDMFGNALYLGHHHIHIQEVDDLPVVSVADSVVLAPPAIEDLEFILRLSYSDSDNPTNNGIACQATPQTSNLVVRPHAIDLSPQCRCDGAGLCTVHLMGAPDFFGQAAVQLRVATAGRDGDWLLDPGLLVWSDPVIKTLTIQPVNDPPELNPSGPVNVSMQEDDDWEIISFQVTEGDWRSGAGPYLESNQEVRVSLAVGGGANASEVFPLNDEHVRLYFRPVATPLNPIKLNAGTSYSNVLIRPANVPLSSGFFELHVKPAVDRFTVGGDAVFSLSFVDNGGGADTTVVNVLIEVTSVNDAPTIGQIGPIEINEGGIAISAPFAVDEGGGPDEDTQLLSFQVSSDNTALIPNQNVQLFYDRNDTLTGDPGEEELFGVLIGDAQSFDRHKVILKARPVDGLSGVANITLTVTDNGDDNGVPSPRSASQTWSVIVHPVGAVHGGWNHLSAISQKTFRRGKPNPNQQCLFTPSQCTDGGGPINCQGSVAPNSRVNALVENVIYSDAANGRCYYSPSTGITSWREINTYCPVSLANKVDGCTGGSCIGDLNPDFYNPLNPNDHAFRAEREGNSFVSRYIYNPDRDLCFRSFGDNPEDWEVYFPSKVTLEWADFIMSGSGADVGVFVDGWNIYRRRHGEAYDFSTPLNPTPLNRTARSFVDSHANANTLYYYSVRPLDNKRRIPTATREVFSEVRILTPPANQVFVHRWMVNQEVCQKMHLGADIEKENSFRCRFSGPGQVTKDGLNYYDIQTDLFVDIAEAGCPYSTSFTADPVDVSDSCGPNGCIGINLPAVAPSVVGLIFYNRGNGRCYMSRNSGGMVWREIDTLFDIAPTDPINSAFVPMADQSMTALLPPLTNITQQSAFNVCRARPTLPVVDGMNGGVPLNSRLPRRKEQIAYSAHPRNLTATEIDQRERGLSLNTSSKCNSSGANGLISGYTNAQIPSTSFSYSIPGTDASNIRSMHTASIPVGQSKSTELCHSRYGVQDPYGNVAEWVSDRFDCFENWCEGIHDPGFSADMLDVDNNDLFVGDSVLDFYTMDGEIGPCRDANSDGICDDQDRPLTTWRLQDKTFNASFFSFPLGLPFNRNFTLNFPPNLNEISKTLLEIGPTSGITNANLHNDGVFINAEAIEAQAPGLTLGAMATGGGYTQGDRAGRFTFELVPLSPISAQAAQNGVIPSPIPGDEIIFDVRQPGSFGNDIVIRLIGGGSAGSEVVNVSGLTITVTIESGVSTGTQIVSALRANASANSLIVVNNDLAYANPAAFLSTESGGRPSGGIDAVPHVRPDIGLRCLVPIPPNAYQNDGFHPYSGYLTYP
jgi:hypothetical protein